jgi:hypothetical protein
MNKLILFVLLFTGCTHTVVNVTLNPPEQIEMHHSSMLRRGCYKAKGNIKGKATASIYAQDRAMSKDLASTVDTGINAARPSVTGPVVAQDADDDQECKPE